jgi:hypothetical protein
MLDILIVSLVLNIIDQSRSSAAVNHRPAMYYCSQLHEITDLIHACACSVYQALSPPLLKGLGTRLRRIF